MRARRLPPPNCLGQWSVVRCDGTVLPPEDTPFIRALYLVRPGADGERGQVGGPGSWASCTMETTSRTAPSATSAYRPPRRGNRVLMPTRKRTLARKTVVRTYLSDLSPASDPAAKAVVGLPVQRLPLPQARAVGTAACRSGPAARCGLVSGLVARHASNATRKPGRKRRSARAIACLFTGRVGGEPRLEGRGVEVSDSSIAAMLARLAFVRAVEASAQADPRLGAPFRRRVSGPGGHHRDDRQQDGLDDRDQAVPVRSCASCPSLGLRAPGDLLPDLLRGQPLWHVNSSVRPRTPWASGAVCLAGGNCDLRVAGVVKSLPRCTEKWV